MFNTKALLAIIAVFTLTLAYTTNNHDFHETKISEVAGCYA